MFMDSNYYSASHYISYINGIFGYYYGLSFHGCPRWDLLAYVDELSAYCDSYITNVLSKSDFIMVLFLLFGALYSTVRPRPGPRP